ncbi:hypothetical protein JTB14_017158 [Gonioctena quinquepunctata]|nr:hypothetical protein JTB14_017158 [Gonioctena quinquepunctata]
MDVDNTVYDRSLTMIAKIIQPDDHLISILKRLSIPYLATKEHRQEFVKYGKVIPRMSTLEKTKQLLTTEAVGTAHDMNNTGIYTST